MVNRAVVLVAPPATGTEAANFDLEDERTEGQTTAATPQLMNALAAILRIFRSRN